MSCLIPWVRSRCDTCPCRTPQLRLLRSQCTADSCLDMLQHTYAPIFTRTKTIVSKNKKKSYLCYCISFHHFNVYVENFLPYVTLYLYVCWCYDLRLSDINKETTYLLTYLLTYLYSEMAAGKCFRWQVEHMRTSIYRSEWLDSGQSLVVAWQRCIDE